MRPTILFILAALIAMPPIASLAAPTNTVEVPASDGEDIPRGAPTDDYGFVAWCYGALSESLDVYDRITPQLKAIDALFGSPVKEDVPYAQDVVGERRALKRFAAAMAAVERLSPTIAPAGQADMAKGRNIWARAEHMEPRRLADTWLYWGVPNRCETTAAALKARAAKPDQIAEITDLAMAGAAAAGSPASDAAQIQPPLEAELRLHRPASAIAASSRPIGPIDPDGPVSSAGGWGGASRDNQP